MKKSMKITRTLSLVNLLLVLTLSAFAQSASELKCRPDDKLCLELAKTNAKPRIGQHVAQAEPQGTNDTRTADAISKTVSAKFVADSDILASKKAFTEPVYPKPTPTPDDTTAAPPKPASNGSNPADLITRVEMKYQFQSFASGYLHGVPIIRGDYAFTPTVAFRMDLPILTFDSKTPGAPSQSGIGDIVTSMTFVKIFSRKFIGALVPRIDFPTATHASLGSGKYSFKPTLAGVTPLAKGLLFAQALEYRVSFAGNKNRADINELSIKPILLKSFLDGPMKGYYINPKLEVIIDFENNNNTTLQAGAEFGKALNKNVVVFVIPTAHVAGTRKESFKLEVGFRYLFR